LHSTQGEYEKMNEQQFNYLFDFTYMAQQGHSFFPLDTGIHYAFKYSAMLAPSRKIRVQSYTHVLNR